MIQFLLLVSYVGGSYVPEEYNGISINITPGPTEAETTITHSGTDVKLLTEEEQETFHLTADYLKQAVESLTHQKPTDVFIQAAPENDFYKTNSCWREVKRNFTVKSIKIANVTTGVEMQQDINITNHRADTENSVNGVPMYRIYSAFLSTHYLSGNDNVSAKVEYKFYKLHQLLPIIPVIPIATDYSHGYRIKVGEYKPLTVGLQIKRHNDAEAEFHLNPGQSAKFSGFTNTVTIKINVEYETKLTGDVVVRYADKHEGKEFLSYDVNELLRALNMTAVVETHEIVTISYVKDYPVKLVDIATGKDIPFTDLGSHTIKDHHYAFNATKSWCFRNGQLPETGVLNVIKKILTFGYFSDLIKSFSEVKCRDLLC